MEEQLLRLRQLHDAALVDDRDAVGDKPHHRFQDPMASLNERAKVDYIVSEGLINHHLYKDEDDRKRKPADTGLMRVIARPMVVLPDPDSPTREKVSPL